MTEEPTKAIDYIIANAGKFAAAKANRIYIEEYRKSKKAILMSQCDAKAANEREQYAYSHEEYLQLLDGLKSAVEEEEKLRWLFVAAQAKVEIWRTQCANDRNQDRIMK